MLKLGSFDFGSVFQVVVLVTIVASVHGTNNPLCDTGPDSLTQTLPFFFPGFDAPVPQVCIPSFGAQGDETQRCFYVYVPDCAGVNSPLVFDSHGLTSCPLFSAEYTGWLQKADDNCFVLTWPLGITDENVADDTCHNFPGGVPVGNDDAAANSITPNCCCQKDGIPVADTVADPAFFRDIAIEINETFTGGAVTIDTKRIYMAGHSNGCMASLAMAALHSDMVAAVCCHAGTAVTPFAADYSAVPTWIVHGARDLIIPYNGTQSELGFAIMSQLDQFQRISTANGCDNSTTEIMSVSDDNNLVVGESMTRSGCTNNATVRLVTLFESGHTPYFRSDETDEGASSTMVDTTQLAWDFCSAYSKTTAPDLSRSTVMIEPDTDPTSGSIVLTSCVLGVASSFVAFMITY